MNYGLINYQKQNGKSGIFWQQERKKTDQKKFGYRNKEQKFFLRTHPKNADRIDPDADREQILTLPEKKKPEKDFIAKNRTQVANKNKKPVKKDEGDKTDKNSGLITLTQDQLNAILASVGQVVSGKEDNLRISVDSSKNEIKIESPRKNKDDDRNSDYSDDDKYSRDRHEKEVKKSRKKKNDKEDSIFSLLGDSTDRDDSRDKRKEESKKNKRKDFKLFSDEENDNESAIEERNRERRRERSRQRSRERHRKRNETPSRERERSRESDYDDRKRKKADELNHKNREKDRESDVKIIRKEKIREDKIRDYEEKERKRKKDRDSEKSRDKKTDRDSEKTNNKSSKDNETSKKKEKEDDENNNKTAAVLTPREVAGIPLSLPWKHMTKAERYRLMKARMQAEEAVKAAAEAKAKKIEDERLEKEREERREYEKKRRERDARREKEEKRAKEKREREREDSPEDRRREDSRDERRGRRRDDSRERRYRNDSRDRRRRDDSYERTRSPADSDYNDSFPKREPKKEITHLPPAGPSAFPKPLSLAEKKRLQWEKERIESKKGFDPWGKPGAGAPIRTRSGNIAADYRSRQEESMRMSIEEEVEKQYEPKPERKLPSYDDRPPPSQQNVPAAMRSSFIFGQIAPDSDRFEDTKEQARKQWLKDLEKQMEEKKQQKNPQESDTWAEKSTKPVYEPTVELDTGRVNSAPQPGDDSENKTYIRGQNVYMDPVTKREQEEKYRRIMEHQKAVMQQVEEKQRLKQMERERKMKEDMEEEQKLKNERDRLQRQFEQEQNKVKMKEVKRQQEIDKLKAAMDEAAEKALIDKMTKRMQHLEAGGHDVSQLKATLEDPHTGRLTARLTGREQEYTSRNLAQMSPRNKAAVVVAPTSVPGLDLDLSPRGQPPPKIKTTDRGEAVTEGFYTENRILTPSNLRNTHRLGENREFGTQTVDLDKILTTQRDDSEIEILYKGRRVRVKSAPKEDPADLKSKKKPQPPKSGQGKSKQEKKEKGPPVWNFQNKKRKKPVKNSEKDLNFNEKRKESELRRQKREQELIRLVDLNRDIIPTEKRTPSNSRGQSPVSDRGGRTPRSLDRTERTRRSKSHSPDNHYSRRGKSSPLPSNRHSSPPIPALRYRPDQGEGIDSLLNSDRGVKVQKYHDHDPLSLPVAEGEFVPFTRTVEILNPAHAGSPVPVSREATHITNARKAYIKGMKPGDYGRKEHQYEDRMTMPGEKQHVKDPILNPSLVTDHPTQRQDAILQQLSSLKMNLMQRQRELETFSPTDFE